jgi:hypothetical protein
MEHTTGAQQGRPQDANKHLKMNTHKLFRRNKGIAFRDITVVTSMKVSAF